MSDYKQVETTVDVPMDAGIDGFLLAIRQILSLPKVVELRVFDKGKVSYKRWVREEDDANANLRVEFDSVTPIGVIRNNDIIDLGIADSSPAVAVCKMLQRAMTDHMFPATFVVGANSVFFDWFSSCGVDMPKNTERLFGHKLLRDRFVEDEALLLCVAYGPGGSLIDTRLTYKLLLPAREAPVRYQSGESNEDLGSGGEGRTGQPREAVRAPEVGRPGTGSGGRPASIPIPDLSGGGGAGNRPGAGRPGPGRRP